MPIGRSMQILIVDDERTSAAIHGAYVRKLANFEAVCFGNPGDALDWARTHEPALVIVDYFMPVMDGVEFTRRLRRLPGKDSTPVVMVTGFGDEDVRQLARAAGVNEFLIKPVDRIELSACILNLSAMRSTLKKAAVSLGHPHDYDDIDSAALGTILAERDRLRALNEGEPSKPQPLGNARVAVESPVSRPSEDILILDDERTSTAVLDGYVRKLNCFPARFAHPHEALAWCKTHEPWAVIVDYIMPDMDGLEFTRRFRLLPGKADVPVLMVSAHGDLALRHAAVAAGVNEFLHKPVDAADLTGHIRTMLAARAIQKRLQKHERLIANRGSRDPTGG